jgi:uncharacterized membrane protein YdbT with pleckstrin-like domain
VQNLAPTLIGTLTIFGIVVQNETVFLWTLIIIAVTCIVSTAQMVRHEIQRCLRLRLIDQRRKRRYANSTDC